MSGSHNTTKEHRISTKNSRVVSLQRISELFFQLPTKKRIQIPIATAVCHDSSQVTKIFKPIRVSKVCTITPIELEILGGNEEKTDIIHVSPRAEFLFVHTLWSQSRELSPDQ